MYCGSTAHFKGEISMIKNEAKHGPEWAHTISNLESQVAACNALLDKLLLMKPGDDLDIIGELQDALCRLPDGVRVQ